MSSVKSDAGQEAANRHEADAVADNASNNPETEVQVSSTPGQTQCSICHSTFRRPEHLKRHFRSHTKEKPFECAQCGRHFSRTDTLHRHELSHHTLGPEGGKDRMHRITVKTFRACFKCAVARVRCSGGSPCVRCEHRSLECQYPTERRSKTKSRKEIPQRSSPFEENAMLGQASQHASPPSPAGVNIGREEIRDEPRNEPPRFQITEFQLDITRSNRITGPFLRDKTAVGDSRADSRDERVATREGRVATEAKKSGSRLVSSDTAGSSTATRADLPPFSDFNAQQVYSYLPTSGVESVFPPGTAPSANDQIRDHEPVDAASSTVNLETPAVGSHPFQLEFDSPFLDQSMVSALNWLPNDMFPENLSNQPLSRPPPIADQLVTLENSSNRPAWLPPVVDTHPISSSVRDGLSQTPSGHMSLDPEAGTPDHLSRSIGEISTHSGPPHAAKRSADYYVDGAGSRLPKYRRKRGSWSGSSVEPINILSPLHQSDTPALFSFPPAQEVRLDTIAEEEAILNRRIEPSTYDKIHQSFLQLCRTDNSLYPRFHTSNFPSAAALSSFIHLYFDSFQPVYPIFHSPTFDPDNCHWLVTLAVSAIGCRFASLSALDECAAAFDEFLRRAINIEKEKCRLERTPLWLLQAMTLNCVGMLHSSSEKVRTSTLNVFSDLVNFTLQEGLIGSTSKSRFMFREYPLEQKWHIWIEDEIRRRTGYLIWLLDCTLAYNFDKHPLLSLDDGQAPLPSRGSLWQAQSSEKWNELCKKAPDSRDISLYNAVLTIYIEKRLVPNIGEFSHVLLIHALYHRMWEVGDYFRRPLSFWNPTAKKQSLETAIPSGSVWLPGIPSYSKWRNSACDCLDILHWTANSTIAKAAGLEHPTVLHLHAARIILLAPFREIRSLATSLALGKIRWREHQQALEWHYISRWIKHDQYKARLAIIHAGTTLWHVRRYSTNAFHEPIAVYLSVLTLWAYGLCHAQQLQDANSRYAAQHEPTREPTFIHLDRPCDDELVQLFVREGHSMRGNVMGVGDICAPDGPALILRVGCEILASLSSWGISKRFIAVLTKLAELSSQPQVP